MFSDRLIEESDRQWMVKCLGKACEEYLEDTLEMLLDRLLDNPRDEVYFLAIFFFFFLF